MLFFPYLTRQTRWNQWTHNLPLARKWSVISSRSSAEIAVLLTLSCFSIFGSNPVSKMLEDLKCHLQVPPELVWVFQEVSCEWMVRSICSRFWMYFLTQGRVFLGLLSFSHSKSTNTAAAAVLCLHTDITQRERSERVLCFGSLSCEVLKKDLAPRTQLLWQRKTRCRLLP